MREHIGNIWGTQSGAASHMCLKGGRKEVTSLGGSTMFHSELKSTQISLDPELTMENQHLSIVYPRRTLDVCCGQNAECGRSPRSHQL